LTARLSQAEIARLNTWIGAIAASLKPEDAAEYDGAELRLGSLCLSADGKWYRWSANKGGRGALSLIAHLRGCSELEAVFWARQWLSAHPSDGKALDSISDHDKATRRAANLERILTESAEDTSGTAAEAYLRGRGLEPPYSSSVRFLLDSRIGEHGAVFVLTDAADEIVGAQVVNIDPLGRKSTVAPIKQTFTRKPEPQAALRLSCGEPAEGAADLVIVEGLENALACWKAGAGRRVIGVPGVSRLEKVELPKGANVVFFPDGKDAPNSEAAATAKSALACWYLAGVHLRIAKTPMGEDANSVLLACAAEGLRHLGEEAEPYALPSEGAPKAAVDATAQRHATLRKNDPVGYERERKEVAEKLGSRPSTWDAVVARAIAQIGEEAGQGDGDKFTLPDPELYQEPVEGAELLNDIARTVSRFLVLPRGGSSLLALWVVHTHAHDAADHSPILAVTSAEKRCGKTNLLHLLLRLTPRAFESANITAAVLFRVTEACRPTLLIDEADTFLRDDDLRGMLNKGHSKEGAFVPRCVGDEHEPRKFSVWTPKAIACIGSLHPTLTDRAISIRMKRRLKSERVERYRARRHGPELEELCSKAARWTADHRHLLEDADPSLPEALDDRAMDNW
jgi:hypothetical protein